MRRFGDLTLGPQAFAGACARTARWSGKATRVSGIALTLLAVALSGCGPVGYLQQVHRRATAAIEEARRAGAESAAPYEYTSAVAYLAKAREEGDQAAYGSAIELGRRAEAFAAQASLIARRQKQDRPPPGAAGADALEPVRGPSP